MAQKNSGITSEEALIGEFWGPLAAGFPGAFGLGDDCAVIAPPHGCELVVTTDGIIAGVHVLGDEEPGAIAWKALAVNVSDLVAKGANPLAYVMGIALPGNPQRAWLRQFADGLGQAQAAFGCQLIGGDTDCTPGPLSVSITAFGSVPSGGMLRRSTARPGDLVYVSGTIGDAALGLALRRDPSMRERCRLDEAACRYLDAKFRRPQPPIKLTAALRAYASASMDVSDGLIKDFDRLCRASGAGGRIEAARVPLSDAAQTIVARSGATIADLMTGGEDYEVLAAIPAQRAAEYERSAVAAGIAVTRIGAIAEACDGIAALDASGQQMQLARTGWDHLRDSDAT